MEKFSRRSPYGFIGMPAGIQTIPASDTLSFFYEAASSISF
jgi:hypothetical protein